MQKFLKDTHHREAYTRQNSFFFIIISKVSLCVIANLNRQTMSYTCTYNNPYFVKFSDFKTLLEHGLRGRGWYTLYTVCYYDIMFIIRLYHQIFDFM